MNEKAITVVTLSIDKDGHYWSPCGAIGIKPVVGSDDPYTAIYKIFNAHGRVFEEGPLTSIQEVYRQAFSHPLPFELILDQTPQIKKASLKIGLGHLTIGTRYRIKDPRIIKSAGRDEFTVHAVYPNGSNSWAVECLETYRDPDPLNEGQTVTNRHGHNLNHVAEIIDRPLGQPAWVPRALVPNINRFKRYGRFMDIKDVAAAISSAVHGTVMTGHYLDQEKFFDRMVAMGWVKAITVPSKRLEFDPSAAALRIYVVDYRKCIRFISKNPHWAFKNMKDSCVLEQDFWNDVYDTFPDDE